MCFGCLGVLIAAGFLTEVPPTLAAKLTSTNETRGCFVQTKMTPEGSSYVTKGIYHIRPGRDFTWITKTPFETTFYATPQHYTYANEDEKVTRALKDLPGLNRMSEKGFGDFAVFFQLFDALYTEQEGKFFLKAKPKVADLQRVLDRVEAEGTLTNWTLRITFTNKTCFSLEFHDQEHVQ